MDVKLRLKERFVDWLLKGSELELKALKVKQLSVGRGSITLSPAAVGDLLRWSAAGPAPAALDLSMAASGVPTWFRAAAVRTGADIDQAALGAVQGNSGAAAIGVGATVFVGTGVGQSATEADITVLAPRAGTLRNLRAMAATNTRADATTVTVMVNLVGTGVTVSITAGSTALFSDAVNTVAVAAGDRIDFRIVTGAGAGAIAQVALGLEIV